jgi:hypothetical protein
MPKKQPAPANNTAELDKRARAAGYRNHEQMVAFLRRRSEKTGGTVTKPAKPAKKKGSDNAFSWHPKKLLEYTKKKWNDATGD